MSERKFFGFLIGAMLFSAAIERVFIRDAMTWQLIAVCSECAIAILYVLVMMALGEM